MSDVSEEEFSLEAIEAVIRTGVYPSLEQLAWLCAKVRAQVGDEGRSDPVPASLSPADDEDECVYCGHSRWQHRPSCGAWPTDPPCDCDAFESVPIIPPAAHRTGLLVWPCQNRLDHPPHDHQAVVARAVTKGPVRCPGRPTPPTPERLESEHRCSSACADDPNCPVIAAYNAGERLEALERVAAAARWVHGDSVCENFDTSRGDLNCYREPPEGWATEHRPCLRCALDALTSLSAPGEQT